MTSFRLTSVCVFCCLSRLGTELRHKQEITNNNGMSLPSIDLIKSLIRISELKIAVSSFFEGLVDKD